jgi:GNAT superfamily N-acetyltransferase
MTARAAIRPATPADVPGIAAVLAANGEPLEQPDVTGYPYLDFLLGRGRVAVAELAGVIVGFGSVVRVGDAAVVTDLFVDPRHHGRGIGSTLLTETLADQPLRMTFSSADPRALPAYVRAGMRPWWPNLYVRADPAAVHRLPSSHSISAAPAGVDETAEVSRFLTGIDRRADFAFYASQAKAAGFVVRDGREIAGVGWTHHGPEGDGQELAHLQVADGADVVDVVAALVRAAAGVGNGSAWACVPGPNPALNALLQAGARIFDRDTFCTSDPGWLDPERILPNPGLL